MIKELTKEKHLKYILNDLQDYANGKFVSPLELVDSECELLLNYITNLQKEKDNYKQRNEKAIEWCECVVNAKYTADKLPNGKITDMGYCLDLAKPLLNILEGGDE